jgi:hypothetical protein
MFDDYEEHYDAEYRVQRTTNNKKRAQKRRWREIERVKERRQLSQKIVGDDNLYYDLLESSAY